METQAKAINNQHSSDIIWFTDMGIEDVPKVGGKNASLGEMIRHLRSVYVENIQGIVENKQIQKFRINAKITFVLDEK